MEARNYEWILPSYRNFGFDWSQVRSKATIENQKLFVTSDIDFPELD